MSDFIIIILMTWGFLIFGFIKKDYTISAISGFMLMTIGVGIIIYGISEVPPFIIQTFGIIHIAMGFYILTRGGWETYKDLRLDTGSELVIRLKKFINNRRRNN